MHDLTVFQNSSMELRNKDIIDAVIPSFKQEFSGGTIIVPAVPSGQTKTLATTDQLPDPHLYAGASAFNSVKNVLANLVSYLQNWADVGNLNMNDILTEVDPGNILELREQEIIS